MIIFLLAMTLAAASPATAQIVAASDQSPADTLGPGRRGDIDVMAADWISYKSRAYRMMAVFLEAAVKDGWDRRSMTDILKKTRALAASVEETQYAAAEMAKEQIRASMPPSAERLARENAVSKVFEVRALAVYANLIPRIVDESVKDRQGRIYGRRLAGPEWAVGLTFDEGKAASSWHLARTGFTPDQYHDFENRAAFALGKPLIPEKP